MKHNDRTIGVNTQRLKELIKAKGFRSIEALAEACRIGNQHVSADTIRRLLAGGKSYRKTIEAIATALGRTFEDLTEATEVRKAHGLWHLYEEDIELPGHFEYAVAPKRFEAMIRIEQRGRMLTGSGLDQDQDTIQIHAELTDDGQYITGKYILNNDRLRLVGVFCLKYLNYGNRMKGYCLHRDTEHESDHVLGVLRAEYHGPDEDRASR